MTLRRAGLLKSRAGVGGGYRLARAPAHIKITEVLDLLQHGDEAENGKSEARSPGEFGVSIIVGRLDQLIGRALGDLTLEKLLDQIPRTAGQATGMYYI